MTWQAWLLIWLGTQNGHLFLSEYIAEAQLAGIDTTEACEEFHKFVNETRVAPGLFERKPGYPDINSHDNHVGLTLGGSRCKKSDTNIVAVELQAELSARGWAFNDVDPKRYDIRGQLTPKDIVPIKLEAGQLPAIWETLYASIDLCVGRSWNLKRARMLIYERHIDTLPQLHAMILGPCIWWGKQKVDYVKAACGYHGEDSPVCQAIKKSGGAWR